MLASTSSSRAAVRGAAVAPLPRPAVARAAPAPSPRRRNTTRSTRSDGDGAAPAADVDTAKEAIDAGLALFQQGRYADALGLFERAPTLPGTGTKRFRDKPPAASDGERQASLFNAACCHSRLGDADQGLAALAACLGAGYEDWAQVEGDADLAPLRADPRFAQLAARYKPRGGGGFLGALFGGGQK